MTKGKRAWFIAAAFAVALALFAAHELTRPGQPEYFTAPVERGDVRNVVQVTGTINAVTTVLVGSQVSGTIAKLGADFNSRVHKGDVIALIEPALFRGALLQAEADLESAKASVAAARANLEKARATEVQTKADYDRAVVLMAQDSISRQALDLAKSNYESAAASVKAAVAAISEAEAQVSQKAAAVSVARTNLAYTVIRSPIDGTVVARNVDVGQTVAASLQAPTLFTIAQDLTKMQVYAKTDESDVGSVRVGREVTFRVDAYPKDFFRGVVSQVRMNPTMVQNVVTYDTIVDFDNPELKLFPGMTAYVTIPVATARDVLKIPNAALRFKPPMSQDEMQALFRRYGIADDLGHETAASPPRGPSAEEGVTPNHSRSPVSGGKANAGEREAATRAIVWKLNPDNTLEPLEVALGITDHTYTAAIGTGRAGVRPGDLLVTASLGTSPQPAGAARIGVPARK